ncbi:MAG: hypothetical protein AAF715_32570 [Myxococcota bacterium]
MSNITPTGAPAWVKTNDHTTYGGRVDKRNFGGKGSVNGRTDVSAEEFVRICADLEAVVKTASLGAITYVADDATPANPTIESVASMVDPPTIERVADGVVTMTWSASYLDEYGVSGLINLMGAIVTVHGTAAAVATFAIEDPNADGRAERLRITVVDASGALQNARVTVVPFTGLGSS